MNEDKYEYKLTGLAVCGGWDPADIGLAQKRFAKHTKTKIEKKRRAKNRQAKKSRKRNRK